MTPRSEAIAFRAWQVASRMGWDCTVAEVADEIGESVHAVTAIIMAKGWRERFRPGAGARGSMFWGTRKKSTLNSFLSVEASFTERSVIRDIKRQCGLAEASQ